MIDFKVISNTDDEIEIEITQPNDLMGDGEWWTEEDWKIWKDKMDELEKNGTKGDLETIRIKLKKNPFLDGNSFIGGSTTEFREIDLDSQGPEIQSE